MSKFGALQDNYEKYVHKYRYGIYSIVSYHVLADVPALA